LKDKICIVTGATSGIGKAIAIGLAKRSATLVLPCRDLEKGNALANEIGSQMPQAEIYVMRLDLSSQNAIRSFVKDFQSRFYHLDVLINNAGVVNKHLIKTKDGIEETFAVNMLASFMLNNLLLPDLQRAEQGKIINMSSWTHTKGKINFDDINGERRYSGLRAYAQSALARILITYEQARRLEHTSVTVNTLHPGGIRTNIGKNNKGVLATLYNFIQLFQRSPAQGAATSLYLATSDEVKNISGKYFVGKKQTRSSDLSYDRELAARCWNLCASLTGIEEK